MKALIIAPRFPWPVHTGDRLRATLWLAALARNADVSLVAPPGRIPSDAPSFRFFAARRSILRCVQSASTFLIGGIPAQSLLAAPYDWDGAIADARREAGPFDVTIVLLSRMHPWVRRSLDGRTVLDAVDSLRRSAHERGRASRAPMRWLWRMEERRMSAVEADAARTYEQIVVVSEIEKDSLDRAVAITNGVSTAPLEPGRREFDFGFWGRFPYFANADAVRWLLDEIWPAILDKYPQATLILGGAEAPRSLRRTAARAGVTLISPVADMSAFARNIRVAIMPLRYGTGESNKVLEAAEAGCALVGTPLALRGLTPLLPHARIGATAELLASAAVDLLNESHRAKLAGGLRTAVERHYSRSSTLNRLWAVAAAKQP